jgi:long-chain fatty acid transport protein
MKRLLALVSVGSCLGIHAGAAEAGGYAFWEQSAAATGRAAAVVATPNDPSAGFYNPAGLADLGGWQLSLGGTYVLPIGSYTTTLNGQSVTYDRAVRGIFPPNIHLYYGKKDSWAAGFSVFNAFGLGIDWPPDFPGASRIDRVDLKTPTLQPAFSWRPSKHFALGVGVSITVATAELQRAVPIAPFPAGSVFLGADGAVGVGGNLGLLFTPIERLRIGLHYRSRMKLSFTGKADFTFDPSIPASVRANLPSDQGGSVEITTPDVLSLGIAYDITRNFTLELDVVHYIWSVFDELRLKFGPPPQGGTAVPGNCTPANAPAGVQHVCSPRNWYDTPQFRLGFDWRATPRFTLRAGYIFDLTPTPSKFVDPILPDSNRHDFSLGVGYSFTRSFRLDFAYMLVYFMPRDAPERLTLAEAAPGEYTSVAHLFALNLGFKF